jgi:hypothetical protein
VDSTETTKDSIQTEVEGEKQEIDIEIENAIRILDSLQNRILDSLQKNSGKEIEPLPSRRD